jgi:hypothetical protein
MKNVDCKLIEDFLPIQAISADLTTALHRGAGRGVEEIER